MKIISAILGITLLCMAAPLFTSAQTQTELKGYSPYVYSKFVEGVIEKNHIKQKMMLNYNIVTEEVIRDQEGKYYAVPAADIDTAFFEDRMFIPVGKTYYEIGADTPIPLLIHCKGTVDQPGQDANPLMSPFVDATSPDLLNSNSVLYKLKLPADFTLFVDIKYYLKKGDQYIQIKNFKQVEAVFPDKTDQLKAYAKEKNLSFSKTEDIEKLVIFAQNRL